MAQSLEVLLLQFLMPDNDARRQAEEQIKLLTKDPQVVPALVHHLRTAKTPNVRQLAAVLLRKKITGHWAKLPTQIRELVKQSIIESITTEHSALVRRASANLIGIIAKYAVPSGEWPDLLPFLFQCSQSRQEDHKEAALILFSTLTETIGDAFQPYFTELQSLLLNCLQDGGSGRVRIAALKAVGSLLECSHDGGDVVKFWEFIPCILNVSRQFLASGEEDAAVIAFEIFDELIESPAPVLGESMKSIVQFSLEVCSNPNLTMITRHQAIQIVSWLAKYKYSSLRKHKLVLPILQVLCPLLAESNNSNHDEISLDGAAAEVIDTMALNLSKHVFPPVLEFASLRGQSNDLKDREASVTSLGVISEGCFELMKDKLEPILCIILTALKDSSQLVRGAASFALGQFAEYLQPEIIGHFRIVLPCLLHAVDDESDDVKGKSYYALAAFCENMGEEILPFIDTLMLKLVGCLHCSSRSVQETCMSAIGSVAAAAESSFIPYAERVLELMKKFLVLTNDEDLRARARATELVGIISMCVGRARMEPILPPFIEAAISGFGLEYCELREYTHGFFSNVAEILEDGFVKYLPYVMPLVLSSCNMDDGSAVDIDGSDNSTGLSSDDEVHDGAHVGNINVRTGVLDEKAAATQALGLFAWHTGQAYAPYLGETLKILVRHSGYFHEDVRLQAVTSLRNMLKSVDAIFGKCVQEWSASARETFSTVMNINMRIMKEDEDKEVVAQACTGVAEIVKDYGYSTVECYMPQLVDMTMDFLREKSVCQLLESDSDDDDGGNERDDGVLMDAVSELLPAFAKVMGSHFQPVFASMFEPLMKFARASSPPTDRTMVVACIAEVAREMCWPISAYVDRVMPLVLRELLSPEAVNRRNAAFCAGELCRNGGDPTLRFYGEILRGLYPLCGEGETNDGVRDNAAGAIARMIMARPEHVPLKEVLPLLLKILPLKEDHEESVAVYTCICSLVSSSNPQVLCVGAELVRVFAHVAASPQETHQVKALVGGAFSHLASVFGQQQMQPILGNLSPAHVTALVSFSRIHTGCPLICP